MSQMASGLQVICNCIRLGNVVACIDLHSLQSRIVQSQSICRIIHGHERLTIIFSYKKLRLRSWTWAKTRSRRRYNILMVKYIVHPYAHWSCNYWPLISCSRLEFASECSNWIERWLLAIGCTGWLSDWGILKDATTIATVSFPCATRLTMSSGDITYRDGVVSCKS